MEYQSGRVSWLGVVYYESFNRAHSTLAQFNVCIYHFHQHLSFRFFIEPYSVLACGCAIFIWYVARDLAIRRLGVLFRKAPTNFTPITFLDNSVEERQASAEDHMTKIDEIDITNISEEDFVKKVVENIGEIKKNENKTLHKDTFIKIFKYTGDFAKLRSKGIK